jgi:hypothetical protein
MVRAQSRARRSRWLPAPAVVVLAGDRFAVARQSGHAVIIVAAVFARLVARSLVADGMATGRWRRGWRRRRRRRSARRLRYRCRGRWRRRRRRRCCRRAGARARQRGCEDSGRTGFGCGGLLARAIRSAGDRDDSHQAHENDRDGDAVRARTPLHALLLGIVMLPLRFVRLFGRCIDAHECLWVHSCRPLERDGCGRLPFGHVIAGRLCASVGGRAASGFPCRAAHGNPPCFWPTTGKVAAASAGPRSSTS